MEKKSGVELQTEPSEGGLKELVLRWFTETQAPFMMHNGNFPDWFQGFTTRKDAEDLLRDKALGCFLIRLSDKTIGYILSYKGHDRCRHFVITQNQEGFFIISGDCQTYGSLVELIEHYKVSPIQPFGEYLTSNSYEEDSSDLYDVVNYEAKGKSGVSVQALRTLWDQRGDQQSELTTNQKLQQPSVCGAVQPPALPLKAKSRRLTGTVSVDAMTLTQGVPPLPKRGIPLGFSLGGSLPDTTLHPIETPAEPNRAKTPPENPKSEPVCNRAEDSAKPSDTSRAVDTPQITYSELTKVESRSRSLPRLDNNMEEEAYSNRITTPASHSPSALKKVTCHTYSLQEPRDGLRLSSSDEMLRSNPLYHSSGGAGGRSAQQGDNMYAEVPQIPTPTTVPETTYEKIPEPGSTNPTNTYETLDDMKTQKSKSQKSTWGKNNLRWKIFFPEHKKK
ncbi:hematopoietic SH2 domain-containing protein homolog [Sphaeramia orbicularis]|uniref:Hematopoietic SH2 domain-containing protein homolog n=1 Tax=Sphaeramia orbicularis TaxID=375764 RepID=A0A673B4F8_9TELE|nr:hematopoietic SH2 domain-containing protein homolog [Sphaeramia orbicularis]